MGLTTILKSAVSVSKAAGRLTGVIGTYDTGVPVKGRRKRLTASVVALLIALLTHFGVPEPIAEPLADIVVELALPDSTR